MASDILIKGMVCGRCIAVIREGIANLGYTVMRVSLGKVSIDEELSKFDHDRINHLLAEQGFELVSNRHMRVVAQTKELIHQMFDERGKHDPRVKFSVLLPEKLHMNYDSISELFKQIEGITVEKFVISKRLEKVKELLVYTNMTLTEIAHHTGFSSINHLSRQFKELTGFSPSHFKSIQANKKQVSGQSVDATVSLRGTL